MANIPMKDIQFPGLDDTYTFAQVDATLTTQGKAADAKKTGDEISELKNDLNQVDTALESKANIDGYYESMTVGNAEQLVATVGIEDKVPYLFRTSGGSADIGDREVDKIVGGTVAWNQMNSYSNAVTANTKYGVTFTARENKFAFTTSGTYEYTSGDRNAYIYNMMSNSYLTAGHKYLVTNTSKYYCAYVYGAGSSSATVSGNVINVNNQGGIIVACSASGGFRISLHGGTNIANNTAMAETIYINCFDLTAMFGSTIADYIYGLETANAGAGVAWFKKLFPKDYYAYDAGTLKSVEGLTAHKMVGFNAWDEEWRLASLNTSTGAWSSIGTYTQIASANMIRVVPGATYYFASSNIGGAYVAKYKEDGTYIGYQQCWATNRIFTVPDDCHYIMFQMNGYGNTYNKDININLSWDGERDGEYEEYKAYTYPLDDSLTLRGIPKLDSDNKLYYDGDTYEADGTVTRRYGVVDLGTLDWDYMEIPAPVANGTMAFKARSFAMKEIPLCICSKYLYVGSYIPLGITNAACGYIYNKNFMVRDDSYTDAATFKTAMNGVYLVYELATPTTETADPFQSPQIVDDFGTEEYVLANDAFPMPVGHETTYQANLRAKLEMSPDSPSDGDGDYIVRQKDGENAYVKLVIPTELPTNPTEAGTYSLKVTVPASGTPTLAWVADT